MSRLFRDIDGERLGSRGSVVCIGAFDGLHLGHRALLGRVRDRARALGCDAAVLSFEPLPREHFAAPGEAPPRLLWPRDRIRGFCELGMDHVGLLRFGPRLAAIEPEDFVRRVLVQRLGAREVWTGADFRFGRRRAGDVGTLARLGAEHGFAAEVMARVDVEDERVSSSAVRALLAAGELDHAARLLGRRYRMGGRVERGQQLGRKLGYPTANIGLGGKRPALMGIFATLVHGVGEGAWPSVSSLGTRPTVDGAAPLLEAHLFDFDGDLYGRRIEVEFVAKLRDEEKFDDLPALVRQMDRDAAQAREVLAAAPTQRGAVA